MEEMERTSDLVPAPDEAVALFRRWFLNRTDCVAIRADWGKPTPVAADDELDALLRAHVGGRNVPRATASYKNRRAVGAQKGRFRVGSYCPGPGNTTKWLCLDLDGTGHAEALADPEATARDACAAFEKAGLPSLLERSGGGHGWHVWVFFDPPIPAAKAQALGRALAPADALLAAGGLADPVSGSGIEVFPKQAKLRKKGYGNLVWLPWWYDAAPGANTFYRVGEDGSLAPCAPTFAAASEEDVDRVLAEHVATQPPVKPTASTSAPSASSTSPAPARSGAPSDPAWAVWREKALAELPLESIYGAWLTGETSGPGWLQCRDPSSTTGDENPSAGVADGTGDAERGTFHSFISGKSLSAFDFLVEQGQAADFRAACARISKDSGVPLPAPTQTTRTTVRPRIRVNARQLRDVLSDAWHVIHKTNTYPTLFQRAGYLVRLSRGEAGPRIENVEETAMYGHLIRIANWVRVTEDAVLDATPPKDIARDMLVNPEDDLPELDAIVAAPVFDADGGLVTTPGYHVNARLWLHKAPDLDVPEVPEQPTQQDVAAARSLLLDDLLVDFPFAAASDRAHAVAALILPFVRRMVSGCTPIHLIEAPTPGSGKGLLADVIAILALGRACDPTTITRDEDEARKKITSILARSQSLILLDNVKDGIDSAQLASAMTAEVWSDRLLGQTKMVDLPNRATWLVTANNPRLSLEIARRCVRVRIDAKQDRPWKRDVFKHTPLRDWARRNRGALIHAVLTLVQSWIAAGRPAAKATLGSFETWAQVIGGVLSHAGIEGFLDDAEELYEHADAEGQEWRQLVAAWWERFGGEWISARDLLGLITEREIFGSVVGDKSERSQLIRLGRALSAARDRHFGDFRLVAGRNSNSKAARYRIERTGGEQDEPSAPSTPTQTDEPADPDAFGDGLDDLFPNLSGTM